MQVVAVDANEVERFLDVAETLASSDPTRVPPLRQVLRKELNGTSASAAHLEQQMFICEHKGQPVGSVVALINRRIEPAGTVIGQLGYFEAIDHDDVAGALFSAADAWLRARGAAVVLGPINGGAQRQHRLLTRGFELPPHIFEPRNPPYYPRLFTRWGFAPVHRWYGYDLDREQVGAAHRKLRRVLAARPPAGEIVPWHPADLAGTLERVHALLDGMWTGHVAYAPLDRDELSEAFAGALSLMGRNNLRFYRENGRDLGCAFSLPDYVDDVRALAGDASGWGRWLGCGRGLPPRVVMHTLALVPEARGSSAALALFAEGLELFAEDGHEEMVVALVVEGFLGRVLGPPSREYALYQRAL